MTQAPLDAALREPAHRVSTRAPAYWRTVAAAQAVLVIAAVAGSYAAPVDRPWWSHVLAVLAGVVVLVPVVVMPGVRWRIHRWEVTPEAVFTRSGWLSREQRIAPLSRVQTVDTRQGALMRPFGLMSVTVTTASAAGPIVVECLDAEVALRLVADLTARTAAVEGDAT